jgi:hypothetical protein
VLRRVTIAITEAEHERLAELAAREHRVPKALAAILLAEAVERAMRRVERRKAAASRERAPR